MKWISPAPTKIPHKDDKLVDRVAWRNPKVYDRMHKLVELEEWIQGIEKIFTTAEVPEDKKVNTWKFYLTAKLMFDGTLLRIGS